MYYVMGYTKVYRKGTKAKKEWRVVAYSKYSKVAQRKFERALEWYKTRDKLKIVEASNAENARKMLQ